jgi:hypothetical protein
VVLAGALIVVVVQVGVVRVLWSSPITAPIMGSAKLTCDHPESPRRSPDMFSGAVHWLYDDLYDDSTYLDDDDDDDEGSSEHHDCCGRDSPNSDALVCLRFQ